MTQEEKAKAYDRAIKRVEDIETGKCPKPFMFTEGLFDYIFPELKENEDEGIKKDIIKNLERYVKCVEDGYDAPSAKDFIVKEIEKQIAWLEKQGETFTKKDVDNAYLQGISDTKNELKKQGEQKPFDYENANIQQNDFAPKVEPKFKVKYAGSEYNVLEVKDIAGVTYYGIEDEPNHIDYVQAENCERVRGHSYGVKEKGNSYPTKSAIFSEQKPDHVLDIEIPFGAKDSELQEASHHIPEGFHAEIEGNRVVIKKGRTEVCLE